MVIEVDYLLCPPPDLGLFSFSFFAPPFKKFTALLIPMKGHSNRKPNGGTASGPARTGPAKAAKSLTMADALAASIKKSASPERKKGSGGGNPTSANSSNSDSSTNSALSRSNSQSNPTSNPPSSTSTSKPSFKTDTDISGGRQIRERELQRWVPDEEPDVALLSLESDDGEWDQFKANKEKFGVESTYDEHLYTTRIDTSAPDYAERVARADKLAREIESQSSLNRHVLEERGLADDSGVDEEDKYSGVDRDANTEKHSKQTSSSNNAADQRGIELMAALKGLPGAAPGNPRYVPPRNRGANYDPAIVTTKRPEKKKESVKPDSIPNKPETDKPKDAFRLNAQSEINSLREFSANFKIPHKMPNDLLPILAKDKIKQDEILKKLQPKKKMDPSKPAFKLNPKAASFTPSKLSPTPPPNYRAGTANGLPRVPNSRAYASSNGLSTLFKKHHQILASEFFGGKIPTAESQKDKAKEFQFAFSLFVTAKNGGVHPVRTFQTPPTWDLTVDQSHDELFPELKGYGVAMMPVPPMMMPGTPFVPSPMMPAGGKFPMSPQPSHLLPQQLPQQAAMAHLQQQQFHAMMYQYPGQSMYGEGFMPPAFVGYGPPSGGGSPVNANVAMGYGYGRRYQKR